jgi:hypothetical protein
VINERDPNRLPEPLARKYFKQARSAAQKHRVACSDALSLISADALPLRSCCPACATSTTTASATATSSRRTA